MAENKETIARHKRNLMLVSTAFVLYVVTATTIEDISAVRVYFLNVEIGRPGVLIYFVWVLLFWYWYRFWQSLVGNQQFKGDRDHLMAQQPFLKNAGRKRIAPTIDSNNELRVGSAVLMRPNKKYVLQVGGVEELKEATTWYLIKDIDNDIHLNAFVWRWLMFRHWLSVAFVKSPAFWDTIFPHIYATVAIAAGLIRGV